MLVNSPRLGAALAESFGVNASQQTSPAHTTVLQRGHGFVTIGSSIEQVTDFAYYAASNARVQTRALLLSAASAANSACGEMSGNTSTGGVKYLSKDERRDTANMNKWIVFKPWNQWVVEVERSGRYVNELGTPPTPEE
jgi:ribulose-5-phosphate 4-epimerase/fuculose-1-phosphate aldolase